MMMPTMTPLTTSDREALERESWIDGATADCWGLSRVNSPEGAELVGRKDREDYAGIVFPVYVPGESAPKEYFLRRDHPPMEGRNGTLKPTQKYLAPPGRGNRLLFGPSESADALTDTRLPIVLVEGLKKQVAAWRLSRWESETPRFLSTALSGVWNFRGTIGKTTDATGARVSIKGVIPDLDRVTWTDRRVYIIYDSDALTNSSVYSAREALADELRSRGAQVIIMFLPSLDDISKTGFDDLLAHLGPQVVLDRLATAQTGAVEALDDPEPISLDALDVPEFPTSVIPVPWLRDMIEATSAATETPVELALLLSLAVVATCVQKRCVVSPEPGYIEPLNLYVAVALDSGCRKSAVVAEATAPLLDVEQRVAARMAPEILQAEAARRLAEDRIKYLRQQAARAKGADRETLRQELFDEEAALPRIPQAPRWWVEDITPEKLGAMMAEHGEKMALFSDEGGIFDTLNGRYSNGVPNLDLFLKAHAGTAVRVDRGSRPSVLMNNPALTIGLSPQPKVLQGLAKMSGFRERGVPARFLFALPKSTLGYRTLHARPIPSGVRTRYRDQIEALLQPPTPHAGADSGPRVIRFSGEAYTEWKSFQRHVEDELRDGGRFESIKDWAGKLPGAVARLAGVLHAADETTTQPTINLSTLNAALTLGGILERHALAVFSLMAVDSTVDAARKVWDWIAREHHVTFSRRDCHHALQGSFPDLTRLLPALNVLVERGYLFPLPLPLPLDNRGGRPSPKFRVNRQFTEAGR